MMPPIDIWWRRAGYPDPDWQGKAKARRAAPEWREGTCCLTGHTGRVVDGRHVVSDTFTDCARDAWAARAALDARRTSIMVGAGGMREHARLVWLRRGWPDLSGNNTPRYYPGFVSSPSYSS